MAVVDGESHDSTATETTLVETSVRLELGHGVARLVLSGVLTGAVSAAAREMLLEACDLAVRAVVLDLQIDLDPSDPEVLPHFVDVAQTRCWAARRRLDVTTTNPEVSEALALAGIWSSSPGPDA